MKSLQVNIQKQTCTSEVCALCVSGMQPELRECVKQARNSLFSQCVAHMGVFMIRNPG